jgi:CHASE1-domain containing sensor protein
VIILSVVVTLSVWYFSKLQFEEKVKARFDREAEQTITLVAERMEKYEDALWGGVATIHSQNNIMDYEKWKRFADTLKIDTKYPGINGIGVIKYVLPKDLDAYLLVEREGRRYFNIHPQHSNKEHWPITYIEPENVNIEALGLDTAYEMNRYKAGKKARNTGESQITGKITLVQDSGRTPGFLFYAPFYNPDIWNTLEERQKNFAGMVYAPFIVKKLMEGTLEDEKR